MSFTEIIVVCYKSHKKHTATLCEQKAELRTALFRVITQGVVVISYGRFGTTYPSLLRGSRNYHDLLPNNPEQRRSHHQKSEITQNVELSNVIPGGTYPYPWTSNVKHFRQ
jgi:hypothetical protein